MTVRLLTVVSIFVSAIASNAFTANIDVFEMGMSSVVYSNGLQDFAWVSSPTNPLAATHHAQLGATEAMTITTIQWDSTGASFDFLFEQTVEDRIDYTSSIVSGGFGITSDVNLWLDYSFTYTFNNLNGGLDITSINSVVQATETRGTDIFRSVGRGGAAFLRPPSGMFFVNRHILLEADEIYGISYDIDISGGSGSGAIGSGAGSLHFTLTPVPEPATATLLAIAGIATIVRRRSRT